MRAHRMHVTVPENRRATVEFPDSVPPGQVELIVLVSAEREETPERASQDALARWDATAAELAIDPRPFRELTLEERRARLRRLRGIGMGLLPSSEDFLRQSVKKSSSRSGSLPAESVYIFDACAIIALLDAEPGAEVVETLLAGESHRCVIHLLNVCEIYYHIYRRADQQRADKLRGVLESYGLEIEICWYRRFGKMRAS